MSDRPLSDSMERSLIALAGQMDLARRDRDRSEWVAQGNWRVNTNSLDALTKRGLAETRMAAWYGPGVGEWRITEAGLAILASMGD